MANPGPVSAVQVGSYFVVQYYQVLQQQPEFAHQFYKEASSMVRIDGDSNESASAMLQIHTLITSLHFTSIEIKTINSLESWSGGVLVVVSGSVRIKDFSGKRKFMQTFLLAPQGEQAYFVLNDVFHFVNEEVIHQHPAPILSERELDSQLATSSPLQEPTGTVSNYALEVEAADYVNSVHTEEDDPTEEYNLQDEQQEEDYEEEDVVEETPAEDSSDLLQNPVHVVQDPLPAVEEPVGEPPKLTYASILRAKGKAISSAVAQPSFAKSTPPASEWHSPPEPVAQQSHYAPSFLPESSTEAADEGSQEEEGESKSVYVRNLSSTVSAADIEEEFKNFGRIKPDGVFIRNRQDVNVCYAFVEFEDVHSVQEAIKSSPIQLAGRQVYIEERRANSSGASRGGRRGRGRVNYQTDSRRGRFGGRSSGRGSNQDGGDYNRPRGNGFRGSY